MKSKLLLLISAAALCAAAYTPVRPLSRLKEQDPAKIVERAPEGAQVTLPARYWRGQAERIDNLASITNALSNGQIILQAQLRELAARYSAATNSLDGAERRAQRLDAFRDYLVEQRDKAALPTTRALYQALIDRIDQQ